MKKKHIIFIILSCFNIYNCVAQKVTTYNKIVYRGCSVSKTVNKCFVNKKLLFTKNNDTIIINQKLPFRLQHATLYDYGIYYNCHLEVDTAYSFKLKKIKLSDIPILHNSYYRINADFIDSLNLSKYIDIRKNTSFLIKGYYDKFFDINNEIYEIIELSPLTGCGIIR